MTSNSQTLLISEELKHQKSLFKFSYTLLILFIPCIVLGIIYIHQHIYQTELYFVHKLQLSYMVQW
jgi:hypothetical protein